MIRGIAVLLTVINILLFWRKITSWEKMKMFDFNLRKLSVQDINIGKFSISFILINNTSSLRFYIKCLCNSYFQIFLKFVKNIFIDIIWGKIAILSIRIWSDKSRNIDITCLFHTWILYMPTWQFLWISLSLSLRFCDFERKWLWIHLSQFWVHFGMVDESRRWWELSIWRLSWNYVNSVSLFVWIPISAPSNNTLNTCMNRMVFSAVDVISWVPFITSLFCNDFIWTNFRVSPFFDS